MIPFKDDNPHTSFPALTIGIIAANVIVFLFELSLGQQQGQMFVASFGMIPKLVSDPLLVEELVNPLPVHPYATLLTSMFLTSGGTCSISGFSGTTSSMRWGG